MTLDWQYTEPFIYLKNKRKKQPNQGHCKMSFSLIKLKDVVNQRKKNMLEKKKEKLTAGKNKKTRGKCVTLFTSNWISLIQLIKSN